MAQQDTQPEKETHMNPWKIATLAIVGASAAAFVSAAGLGKVDGWNGSPAEESAQIEASAPVPQRAPAARVARAAEPASLYREREDCERYALEAQRNNGRVVRDGVVGGVVGAGLGAAGGAIADGGNGAGKGAGIGALVGAAAGTFHGFDQEQRKTEQAQAAYKACLGRRN